MTLHNHESDKETTQANRAAEHIAIRFAKPFDHKTISIAYDNGTNAILSYDSFPDSATLSDDRLVTHIRGVGLYDGFHRTVRERSAIRIPLEYRTVEQTGMECENRGGGSASKMDSRRPSRHTMLLQHVTQYCLTATTLNVRLQPASWHSPCSKPLQIVGRRRPIYLGVLLDLLVA